MNIFHCSSTISKKDGGHGDMAVNLDHVAAVDITKTKRNGELVFSVPIILSSGKVVGEAHASEQIARSRFGEVLEKMGVANVQHIATNYKIDDLTHICGDDDDEPSAKDLLRAIKAAATR